MKVILTRSLSLATLSLLVLTVILAPTAQGEASSRGRVWNSVAQVEPGGQVRDVRVLGSSLALVAGGAAGLQLVDLSLPDQPRLLPNGSMTGFPLAVVLLDGTGNGSLGRVVTARGFEGVELLDLGPQAGVIGDIRSLATVDTPGYAESLVAAGDHLFVADGPAGLTVLKDMDGHYEIVDTYDTPGYARAVEVHDGVAYIADGESGMSIVDLSDPGNATFMGSCGAVGTCGDPTQFTDLTVRDEVAYVVDGDGSLQLFDVTNQSRPVLLGWLDMSGVADSLLLVDDIAYVTTSDGLYEVDCSNTSDPRTLSHSRLPGTPHGLARLDSGHLLVAAGEAGLLVLERMPDGDGDGVGDPLDAFPRNPWYAADSDRDGFPDDAVPGARPVAGHTEHAYLRLDAFPFDRSASLDTDGDGHPDEYNFVGLATNLRLDAFPLDPAASRDSDGDGYPDEWNDGYSEMDSTTGLKLDVAAHNANFATSSDLAALLVLFAALGLLGMAVRGYAGGQRK